MKNKKFAIFTIVLLVAIGGMFLYLETSVENNRTIGPGTMFDYYETYLDKNGAAVTDATTGKISTSQNLQQNKKYESLTEDVQKQVTGKKIGDTITYTANPTTTTGIDESTIPYTYTIIINKVHVNHSYVAPETTTETSTESTTK